MKKVQITIPNEIYKTMMEYKTMTSATLNDQIVHLLQHHIKYFLENKALYKEK